MKIYKMPNGKLYFFEEGHQPESAVPYHEVKEVKKAEVENKAVQPSNKSKETKKK